MQQLLFVIHIIICVALLILVIIQHGKGANMGALFGSGSGNMFGAQATTDAIVKITGWVAFAFFISNLILGYVSLENSTSKSTIINVPASEVTTQDKKLPSNE